MNRVIVNIISEQTIPNYLFIKEMFQIGDKLLFISSQKFAERIEWIKQSLGYVNCTIESILFQDGEEERWKDMESKLQVQLSSECSYIVNLTGGTKYMSLLVQNVFERYNSLFFYIPFPKNELLKLSENDSIALDYRLTVKEYFSNYNVTFTEKKLVKGEAYCDYFFNRFVDGTLNFKAIDLLRSYRNIKKKMAVYSLETCMSTEKKPRIDGLSDFLSNIDFLMEESGYLNRGEIEYLTGGWFEEYLYYKIKKYISPQDIKLGVLIKRTENTNQNDLDVVFISGNKLFVIECKTGILGEKMFNETVYKATAIKEAVLGLSANTFIVSLAPKDDKLKNTAKNMGIQYKCREDIEDSQLFENFIMQIKKTAKD